MTSLADKLKNLGIEDSPFYNWNECRSDASYIERRLRFHSLTKSQLEAVTIVFFYKDVDNVWQQTTKVFDEITRDVENSKIILKAHAPKYCNVVAILDDEGFLIFGPVRTYDMTPKDSYVMTYQVTSEDN